MIMALFMSAFIKFGRSSKVVYLVVDPEGYSWVIFSITSVYSGFALSIATTIFNKRILGFPQAIGVPLVSAILSLFYSGCHY